MGEREGATPLEEIHVEPGQRAEGDSIDGAGAAKVQPYLAVALVDEPAQSPLQFAGAGTAQGPRHTNRDAAIAAGVVARAANGLTAAQRIDAGLSATAVPRALRVNGSPLDCSRSGGRGLHDRGIHDRGVAGAVAARDLRPDDVATGRRGARKPIGQVVSCLVPII